MALFAVAGASPAGEKLEGTLSLALAMQASEDADRMDRRKRASGVTPQTLGRPAASNSQHSSDLMLDTAHLGSDASDAGGISDPTSMKQQRTVFRGMSLYISSSATMRHRVLDILSSQKFDTLMGLIIVVNSVTIGLELSFRLEGRQTAFLDELEHFFMAAYLGELLLRFYAFRCKCLTDTAVIFDCVLVVSGVLVTWIMRPMGLADSEGGLDSGIMVVLRTLRLLRLARTVRLLVKFRVLWMLVRGLMNSAGTMFYTCILLIIILYVLACVGVEMVSMNELAVGNNRTNVEPNAEFQAIVHSNFRSVTVTMMTLVQFICLDSIADIYKPLIQLDPTLVLYFMGTILVIGIVLMNLVTAVVVNSALEQAIQDKEAQAERHTQQKTKLIKELRKLFERMDQDGSGQVSREEISCITEADRQLLQNTLSISDHTEIFDALDVDGSGSLEIEEFCSGIWSVAMSSAPIEVKKIEKQVKILRDEIRESHKIQASMCQAVKTMQEALEQQTQTQQQRRASPTVRHLDKVVVSAGPSAAAVNWPIAVGQVKLPTMSARSTDSPSVASVPLWPPPTPSNLPAWAADFKLRLEQSSREAINEADGSASSSGLQGVTKAPAHTTPLSAQKLVAGLRHLHENIGSLLAEMEHSSSQRSNAFQGVVLGERTTDAANTLTSTANSRDLCGAASADTSRASLSEDEEIPGFSAMLEVLHQLKRGGVRELARELKFSEA